MNKFYLPIILVVFLVAFIFVAKPLLFPTPSVQPEIRVQDDKKRVDTGPFSIELPKSWTYTSELSTNSQVGQFKGEGITLLFDYGRFSNALARDFDPEYDITPITIDRRSAKIIQSKIDRQGITGVYFSNTQLNSPETSGSADVKNSTRLEVHAENLLLENQEKVLSIIKTIRFTD